MIIKGSKTVALLFESGKTIELTYAEYGELERLFGQITFVHPWIPMGPPLDPEQPYRLDIDGAYVVVRN